MKLKLENLKMSYDRVVLENVNLDLENVGVIAILGPSGGGKSTLLRLLAGIEAPDSGNIFLNDNEISEESYDNYHKEIGFVFQSHNLFPHLSVLRNITLILEKVHGIPLDEAEHKTKELLQKFGLIEHINKLPSQLSGGQQQRVSIVRSLAINPQILFFDEPTSSLDPILTYEVLDTILELRRENKDFVIVTHEIGFAKEVADYILFIDEGKIIEEGTTEIMDSPKTPQFQSFLSKVFSFN
jgi:polar amino acid transport system ATP-binding protein